MSEYLHRYQMLVKKFSLSSNCRIGDPFSVFPILFVKLPFQNYSLEDKTLGQYRYALDSTGMFWAVPVCSGQYRFVFGTGMLWAVPVCSGQYRYALGSTGMLWTVPVLPRAYRYCPEHTSLKTKPVLPRAYRYCPEHTGTVQSIPVLPRCFISQTELSWYALLSVKTATKKVIVICAIKMYVV